MISWPWLIPAFIGGAFSMWLTLTLLSNAPDLEEDERGY